MTCLFDIQNGDSRGGMVVSGKVLSDSLVTCISPPHMPALVTLRLSLNGFDYTPLDLSFPFEFLSQMTVGRVSPSVVGLQGGPVTVFGTSFQASDDAHCVVDIGLGVFESTPAIVVDSETLTCNIPEHIGGKVVVNVFINGGTSKYGASVMYINTPIVQSASPLLGPDTGNTVIAFIGSNMIRGMSCQFNNTTVNAVYISESLITCLTPMKTLGDYPVLLSVNGMQFFSSGITYRYTGEPVIVSLDPPLGPDVGGSTVFIRYLNGNHHYM